MRVVSLFDGMSCLMSSMIKAGIPVTEYYSSEIDKHAIKVSNDNYPEIIRMGDVTTWRDWDIDWSSVDLLAAGSPCQGFSFAGKGLAFDDPRSALFFVFIDILNHVKSLNPDVKFLLENVDMMDKHLDVINEMTNVAPIFINSEVVSAQSRPRHYWCNWYVPKPEDRNIGLSDILEPNLPSCGVGARIVGRKLDEQGVRQDNSETIPYSQYLELREDLKANCLTTVYKDSVVPYFKTDKKLVVKFNQKKAGCLTAGGNSGGNHSDMDILVIEPDVCRRYSVTECERLQGLDDGYTKAASNSQAYKMLGNGWQVDTIVHILNHIDNEPIKTVFNQLSIV